MNLLALASLVAACGATPPRASQLAPAGSSSAAPALPASRASGCRATPSTVYGDEPVSFSVEGDGSAHTVRDATLYDASRRVVARTTTRVPGQVRLLDVPSGDFSLLVGTERVSCLVTVNRELSRATPGRN